MSSRAAFVPNVGLKLDPAGNVTYDFDGHLRADGLDLDADAAYPASDDRRVTWRRLTDGAAIADASAVDDGGAGGVAVQLNAYDPDGGRAEAIIATYYQAPGDPPEMEGAAWLSATRDPAGSPDNRLTANAWNDDRTVLHQRDILRGDGRGNFVQDFSGLGRQLHGVYIISVPGLAIGIQANAVLTHGLDSLALRPFGVIHNASGSTGSQIGWAFHLPNPNQIAVEFRNNGPDVTIAAELWFWLLRE